MKSKIIHRFWQVAAALMAGSLFVSLCVFTQNSQGFYRRYLDADLPFVYLLHNSTPAAWVTAIDAGADAWEVLPSSYWEFQNGGFTAVSDDIQDGVNLVFFDQQGINFPPPTNVIAFSRTYTVGSGASYHAIESDLIWNARDFPPSTTGDPSRQDLQGTMSHEFGHHMGLAHTGPIGGPPGCGEAIPAATMYGTSSNGDTTHRSLHIDDIGSAAVMYPTWILNGTVTDANTAAPLEGAELTSSSIYAAVFIGPPETPNGSTWEQPGASVSSVPVDATGAFNAFILQQQFSVDIRFFGYMSSSDQIAFSPPGGIGQTQTLTRNYTLQRSPMAQISGTVTDQNNGTPVPGTISIFAVSNKPGVPATAVATVNIGINGDYAAQVPAEEDYRVELDPVSPYPAGSQTIANLPTGGAQLNFQVIPAEVMLVDDDEGAAYETFYTDALEALSKTYHVWEVSTDGTPTVAQMSQYPDNLVIWFTGDGNGTTLSQAEQDELVGHLNNNGKLFLTGQNIAEQIDGSTLLTMLGLSFAQNSAIPLVVGVAGTIGQGLAFSTSGSGGANNQTSRDQLNVISTATTTTAFTYGAVPTATAGVEFDNGTSRAVFFGFGWEAVGTANARENSLNAILQYLDNLVGIDDPRTAGNLPGEFELQQNFPNPFNPETHIRFSLPQAARVQINIFNALGQQVRTLVDRTLEAGVHSLVWDARDDHGASLPSGVYFYRMSAGNDFRSVRKMLLLR